MIRGNDSEDEAERGKQVLRTIFAEIVRYHHAWKTWEIVYFSLKGQDGPWLSTMG